MARKRHTGFYAFTVPFFFLLVVILLAGHFILSVKSQECRALRAVGTWNRLHARTALLFNFTPGGDETAGAGDPVKTMEAGKLVWLRLIDEFESALAALLESSAAGLQSRATRHKIEDAWRVWILTRDRLGEGRALFEEILASPLGKRLAASTHAERVDGAFSWGTRDGGAGNEIWLFYRLQDSLTDLEVSGRVFNTLLTEISADVSRRADRLIIVIVVTALMISAFIISGAFIFSSRAEQALRDSEEKYRRLVENINEVIYVIDKRGVITYISPSVEALTGYDPESLIGEHFADHIHGDDLPIITRMIKRVIAGEVAPSEFRVLDADGKSRWVQSSSKPLRRDGDVTGLQGVLADISYRKRAEEEKEALESQLRHAQKMEAVGTLAGGVAHDFNNLLQAIRGYADLLLSEQAPDDPAADEVREIIRATGRGSELTSQLLTFSRKVESRLQPINLNREVVKIIEMLRRTILRMAEIDLRLSETLRVIRGDPAQIEQIVVNLAVNARDAFDEEGGRLTVATDTVFLDENFCRRQPEAKPGEYVLMAVSDTGRGMSRVTLDHIFDPFFTTKGVGQGSGLGLAMVYGIVKSHGGLITCESEPGTGTTFSIYFPVLEQEVEFQEPQQTAVAVEGGTETILLVDDEDFLRSLGERMLTRIGYSVITAPDGESGLETFRQRRKEIDLVILDLIMPGMGGRKCLEKMLAIDPQARVLLTSGYMTDDTAQESGDKGACGFLRKPYEMNQLLAAIREALGE